MKNKIKRIIILLVIILICYYGFKLLIVEHNFNYTIDKYKISEHFYINKTHFYDLVINDKKNNYIYTINENMNKKKKIITSIKTYKSNNLLCIIPTYKKNINKNIYCNIDNKQVSNDYLIKSGNEDFKKIRKKIKKYHISLPTSSDKKTKYKKLSIYNKNIVENNVYYVWNYKGIYVIDKNNNKYKKILEYDLYDNVLNCIVKNNFVLFENTKVTGIENVYYYDFNKDKLNKFKLKEKISKDSYINGVVDNLIYITDRRNKKEYTLDIRRKKLEEIDEEQTKYIVYINGKKKTLSKSDYFMSDQLFENVYIKDSKITQSEELIRSGKYYYFKEDNKIYKVLNTNKKSSILLLELNDIKEWKVINDELIILVDDTIYSYKDETGLRKILKSNELNYNYKNIYKVGKK